MALAPPGWAGAARVHPLGIGFYNEIAGGLRGAADMGLQRSFWGYVDFPLIRELDRHRDRGRVFFNRTNWDSYRQYRRDELLPKGFSYANDAKRADMALTFEQPEHGETEAEIWGSLGPRPVAGVYADGVTFGQLYVETQSAGPPPLTCSTSTSSR